MSRFLLDTNIVSEVRKPKPHGAVVAWLEAAPPEELGIPAVVLGELQAGAEMTRLQNPAKAIELEAWIERIASTFQVIPMDGVCFREWARLMRGRSDTFREDAMIAATARVYGYTVATRNTNDFASFGVSLFNPFTYRR